MIAAVLAIIGTIMQAVAFGHIAALFVGRFIAGLGVGAASMVTPLYSKLLLKMFC
jgi:MFS family permease